MSVDCLFCRIISGEVPAQKLHQDDLVVATVTSGRRPHPRLLMPVAHIASAADLTDADGPLLGRLFAVAADLARARAWTVAWRLVSNVGPDAGPVRATISTSTCSGGRAMAWPPDDGHPGRNRPVGRHGRIAAAAGRGPPPVVRAARRRRPPVGVLMIAAQCWAWARAGPRPGHARPGGPGGRRHRGVVVEAARGAAFQVRDPLTPYRPGESPALYAVPRVVIQGVLPSPAGGYVVIYELEGNVECGPRGPRLRRVPRLRDGANPVSARLAGSCSGVSGARWCSSRGPRRVPGSEVARMATTLDSIGQPVGG